MSCELMTTEYAVALTSVGSVAIVSGPLHVLEVVEYVIGTFAIRPPGRFFAPNVPEVAL